MFLVCTAKLLCLLLHMTVMHSTYVKYYTRLYVAC